MGRKGISNPKDTNSHKQKNISGKNTIHVQPRTTSEFFIYLILKPNLGNSRLLTTVGINAIINRINGIVSHEALKAEFTPKTLIAKTAAIIAKTVSISRGVSNLLNLLSTNEADSTSGVDLSISCLIGL